MEYSAWADLARFITWSVLIVYLVAIVFAMRRTINKGRELIKRGKHEEIKR